MDRSRKKELSAINARVWAGAIDVFETSSALDSSLKKNTAFIKRIRTSINAASQPTFLSEIRSVSLHKYLSEIITATYEGLCKLKTPADICAGVEIVSALHQRFGPSEFTRRLGWLLGRGLSSPDKAQLKALSQDVREREEKERLARHRVLLRVVTELWLVGALRSLDDTDRPEESGAKVKDGAPSSAKGTEGTSKARPGSITGNRDEIEESDPFPLEVLKELLGHDRDHSNLPLAVVFVKSFGWEVLGVKTLSDEGRKPINTNGETSLETQPFDNGSGDEARQSIVPSEEPLMISENLRNRFKSILTRYFEDVKAHIIRDHRSLNTQSRRNAEAYVKSGEIFEDRQSAFEKQTKTQEKLIGNAQILCDALGAEMPDLTEKEIIDGGLTGTIGLVKTGEYLKGQGDGAGIWEDEEERRFYENLMDLKGRVPSILLDEGNKKKADGEEVPVRKTTKTEVAETDDSAKISEGTQVANDDQSVAIASRTVGAQLDALLTRLPELQTKDMVDNLALEFCFLNSKASRKRLIKAVQEVPKGRSDLLPLYSRLVATLGQYLPNIVQGLISYLDDEFRSLQRRKVKDFLGQVRIANIRYLAELTKFGVVPEHIIFHCLKVSLEDFSRMNIEIIASLLENCGRFLLRNLDTAPRMTSFLETLSRRKSAQHLGPQERMLLENALYYVDPPERTAIQQKERTPTDLFVRQLIYVELGKRNYTKVLKTIRKLHWEEPEVVSILEKVFSKPGKAKFSNIHLLAILVSSLYRYHQDFAISIVDNILEQITLGLEQNDFKFNQRRIAELKYLGELYNYKMFDSTVVFDSLYRIITFGHENGTPAPGKVNPLDMADDYFRVRLVCTVLDTCGVCFDRGSARKKLDFFLTFFQYYLLTKESLPLDVDFMVQDTFSLVRPSWSVATDIGEAARLFSEAITLNYASAGVEKPAELDDEMASSTSSDDLENDEIPKAREAESSSEEAETLPNGDATSADSESEEEHIYVKRPEEERDPGFDAEFDREFEKMMSESNDSRKFERPKMFDEPLPIRSGPKDVSSSQGDPENSASTPSSTMAFSLMTKKGNRQQTRNIDLPSDSHFALAMKKQQQADWEEKQRIKNIVLEAHLREDSAQQDGEPHLSSDSPSLPPLERNPNTKGQRIGPERHNASSTRPEKSSARSGQRGRRLQFSDADWYGENISPENNSPRHTYPRRIH